MTATGTWPPAVGQVDLGDLAGTEPVSRAFGGDRGTPLDRFFIEAFLARHADVIRGRVLEIGESLYTHRFGGGVGEAVILDDPAAGNPQAHILADLQSGDGVPEAAFDCIILTQTLHMTFDVHGVVATIHRALRPGGVCLATVPGITQIDAQDGPSKWFWAITQTGARRLFETRFRPEAITTEVYGNVYAATAFLQGLALEELDTDKLSACDPLYPVITGLRAERRAG